MAVPKTKCGNTWTEGQFNSFIKSMLRRGSIRWQPKYACKKSARHHEKLPNEKGRLVFHSLCASCNNIYPETTCSVDHTSPVVDPYTGFTTWDSVIERLFCEVEGLQVLCEDCHKVKTDREKNVNKERRRRERASQL